MTQIRNALTRANAFAAAGVLVFAAVLAAVPVSSAGALALLNRSLMVSSTVASDDNVAPDETTYDYGSGPGQIPAGDSRNGTKVSHTYTFTVQTTGDIEGFTIEYCNSAFGYVGAGACAGVPTGFSASAWDTETITVNGETFDVRADTANYLTIMLADDEETLEVTENDVITLQFTATESDFFVNPTSAYIGTHGGTYFAHIKTFSTVAAADVAVGLAEPASIDEGTVTTSITQSISIYTRVQETLHFSVEAAADQDNPEATPTNWDGGTCDPLGGVNADGNIFMGDSNNALAHDTTYTAKSYFRLATNSANGTSVFFSGRTLESGNNAITALPDSATPSQDGVEQFGLAVDDADADNTLSALVVIGAYAGADDDEYAFNAASFNNPREFAESSGVVDCETGAIEYVANIGVDTPAGIYTTKINYIASPRY